MSTIWKGMKTVTYNTKVIVKVADGSVGRVTIYEGISISYIDWLFDASSDTVPVAWCDLDVYTQADVNHVKLADYTTLLKETYANIISLHIFFYGLITGAKIDLVGNVIWESFDNIVKNIPKSLGGKP